MIKQTYKYPKCFFRTTHENNFFNETCRCEKYSFDYYLDIDCRETERIEVCHDWFVEQIRKIFTEEEKRFSYCNTRYFNHEYYYEIKKQIIFDSNAPLPYWGVFVKDCLKDVTFQKGDVYYRHKTPFEERCQYKVYFKTIPYRSKNFSEIDFCAYLPFDENYLVKIPALKILEYFCENGVNKADKNLGGYEKSYYIIFQIFDAIVQVFNGGYVSGFGKLRKSVVNPIQQKLLSSRIYTSEEIEIDIIRFLCEVIEKINHYNTEIYY